MKLQNKTAEYLKGLRKAKGLTLQQVGDAIGATAEQIRKLEIGERTMRMHWATKLADLYGVPVQNIFGIGPPPKINAGGNVDTAVLQKTLLWAFQNVWDQLQILSAPERATALTKAYRIIAEEGLTDTKKIGRTVQVVLKAGK